MNNSIMYQEIHMIRDSLNLTYDANKDKIKDFVKTFKEKEISNVVIAARGSSDNVGTYLKYILEIYAHIPVSFAACSVITKYNSYLNFKNTLVIGISQSGSGKDIFEFVDKAKNNGSLTLAITNDSSSIVAKACDYHFCLNLTKEKGLAATKTFISQLYVSLLFVAALTNNQTLNNSLNKLDDLILEVLNNEKHINEISKLMKDFNDIYLLSRGINYVSSLEGALKIQETTYIKAKAYASSDFYHGPMAIADENQNFLLLCSKGMCEDDNHEIYEKLKNVGANLFVISNDEYFNNCKNLIKIPNCDEVIAPFLIIISIQLLACNLSLIRGIDVDNPRNLKKVTITR